jgi:hypothetical protein
MNKFKEGDWVRSIVDRYSRTSYMKPCKVIEVINDYMIKVETCDTYEIWEVESKNFEKCPLNHILHEGDDIGNKRYHDIEYTFVKYERYGIKARNKIMGYLESIPFEYIMYQSGFKV